MPEQIAHITSTVGNTGISMEIDSSSGSETHYHSFSDSDSDDATDDRSVEAAQTERVAREHERALVLEAAGLIVKQDSKFSQRPTKRRAAPATPDHCTPPTSPTPSTLKELPPLPEPHTDDYATRLDDAFERYETFRNTHGDLSLKRLSVVSTPEGPPSSPQSQLTPSHSRESEPRSYSNLFHFLSGSKKTTAEEKPRTSYVISAPIQNPGQVPSRDSSPAFGSVSRLTPPYI